MAGKKISQLTGSLSPSLSGIIPIVLSGTTYSTTLNSLRQVLVDSGSHNFTGSQFISGSLTVNGSITAREYILSSSVTNMVIETVSGSSNFGNSLDDSHKFTEVLLNNLRDKFPTVNFIGMRIMNNYAGRRFASLYTPTDQIENIMEEWKKNKSFSIKTSGYHIYFAMSSEDLSNDVQFEVSLNASKFQIRNAFKKSLNSKKLNKKVLGEFVQLIA